MKSYIFTLLFFFSNLCFSQTIINAAQPQTETDSVLCSCNLENADCGTIQNPMLCYHTPLNWPDSLIDECQYFVFTSQLLPVDRYQFYLNCLTVDSGDIDLGVCGILHFETLPMRAAKSYTFKKPGKCLSFTVEFAWCNGSQETLHIQNGVVNIIGKTPKLKE